MIIELLPDNYVEYDYIQVPKEIKGDLANRNVNTNGVQFVDVATPSRRNWDVAYSYHVSARTGLLLVNQAYKNKDMNSPQRRLKPSEITWQSFLLGAQRGSVRPSRLRCMVLYHILNYNTKNVIYETICRSTSTLEKSSGYREYTDLDDGVYALLGSVLGKSIMHMLLDHKAEIGYRSVDRVVLLSKNGLGPVPQWELARSFLIVLSEPRSPKRPASDPPYSPERSPKRRRLSNSTLYYERCPVTASTQLLVVKRETDPFLVIERSTRALPKSCYEDIGWRRSSDVRRPINVGRSDEPVAA